MATPSNLPRGSIIPQKNFRFLARDQYLLLFEVGAVIALGLLVWAVRLPLTFNDTFEIPVEAQQVVVALEEIEQTQQQAKPPPPPRPPVPVEVPNDTVIEDDILEIDSEIDFDLAADVPPPPPPPAPPKEVEEAEPEIFVVVEQMPELIGGLQSIQGRIKYPEIALKANIEGMVIVQFVVDEQGNVTHPQVVKSLAGGCDEEALRVIRLAKFKPGKQRGKPVRVKYAIPIRFRLRDQT